MLSSPTTVPVYPATEHAVSCRCEFSPPRSSRLLESYDVKAEHFTFLQKHLRMVGPTASFKGQRTNIPGRYIELPGAGLCSSHILTCALRRLSGHAILLPFLANLFFMLLIFCLVHISRYMPCLCILPPRGFSSPTLRRPPLSSPPAYRADLARR